jgi:predicted Ser/Thr protein kinase
MASDDGAENIVSFEVEHRLLQVLSGPHVPRLVAAGDMARLPYLVMEYIEGRTLQHWIDRANQDRKRPAPEDIARLGAAVAAAAHSLPELACPLPRPAG